MAKITPESDEDIITAIRIYRSARIGPRNYASLIAQSENYSDAWARLIEAYEKRKIDPALFCTLEAAETEFERGQDFAAEIIFQGQKDFPDALTETEVAPPFLWAKGDKSLLKKPQIAMVGARNASIEGVRTARHYAQTLSDAGIIVTSGLARGIDAAAHEGALAGGTIGVVAGGLDVFYPRQNKDLQANMFERGVVVSEMPFGHQPQAKNFPQRNRIIAGLAQATLVIEARERSGTLITANDAMSFAREIMAIPGHPFEPRSAGPNLLIQNGARMITAPEQILHFFKIDQVPMDATQHPPSQSVGPPEDVSEFAQMGREEIDGQVVRSFDDQRVKIDN